ncbi:hypothetical protein Xsto_04057 [Xenorhabdus stockiae]|uniref:Uncharacterized protein n=1 Tax=Xenorhabdus stockiae TaxID=351614 RepID=A0A2D0K6R6_9GAMM|nr:hypothetical protein [Xenorhabdus stockiae]PHM59146.1 hypothetical protein Xsto_04057 [Xenorhabdus stockiae]
MSRINLTIKQIQYICDMAGISYEKVEESRLNEEYTIGKVGIQDEGGIYFEQMGVYCTDYPEDGAMSLEDR